MDSDFVAESKPVPLLPSDGEYKFRADYLGYQFWSEIFVVPDTLSATLSIPHQDVAITVENLYGADADPFPNIPVYLFKPPSSYLGKSATTDTGGQVIFNRVGGRRVGGRS